MAKKSKLPVAQTPLILRCHRLMEAFAKSDDERDFYLDKVEGFIIYVDLDKGTNDLQTLEKELESQPERYCPIPKLSFFEAKKIMEGFVQEKVYDIDTKEKLLDIIHSKEARENFLEFIYDHHNELEKWQQYYQERSRIRIIEWLRNNQFHFVFEEDLDIAKNVMEKLKKTLFQSRVAQDVAVARKMLVSKAKTYYSNEALNPRPKRGRPPKQAAKTEIEPQVTIDIYTQVPNIVRPFLFTPEITSAAEVTFSAKFDSEEDLLHHRRGTGPSSTDLALESLNKKLASLRNISSSWLEESEPARKAGLGLASSYSINLESPEEKGVKEEPPAPKSKKATTNKAPTKKAVKKTPAKKAPAKKAPAKKAAPEKTATKKTRMRPLRTTKAAAQKTPVKKTTAKKTTPKKAPAKKAPTKKVFKKTPDKKAPAKKKVAAKKTPVKKATTKKAPAKKKKR